MQRMRFGLLEFVAISLLWTGFGWAEETRVQPDPMEPLAIIQDCLAAVKDGDFGRYVDHLSPTEQKLQAGYALLVNSMWSQWGESLDLCSDPETLLLYRALNEIVLQHSLPESQWGPEQQAAEKACQAMFSQAVSCAFAQAGYSQPVVAPSGTVGIYEVCIRSAGILKDPQEFLAAALAELSRPTVVTGEGARVGSKSSPIGELAADYAALKWTLFTRGDYAIAAAANPLQGEPSPVASGPERVNGCAVAEPHTQVEFQRIDGLWKIVRLLPTSALMSTTDVSPSQTYACPPQTYYPSTPTPSALPPSAAPASVPVVPAEPIVPGINPYLR